MTIINEGDLVFDMFPVENNKDKRWYRSQGFCYEPYIIYETFVQ